MSDLQHLQRLLVRVERLHAAQMEAYTQARETCTTLGTLARADRTQVRIWQIERRIAALEMNSK